MANFNISGQSFGCIAVDYAYPQTGFIFISCCEVDFKRFLVYLCFGTKTRFG